ncbi:hypothetical protein WJX72_002602 [[Myrmecia] bisecta]|uniref:Uncharacterized protein n=1 Tax=[Myrmecia] bisecta TaxID=41462 RepID=A0AAW1Q263_9CHLO
MGASTMPLVWSEVTQAHCTALRTAATLDEARSVLAECSGLTDLQDARQAIELDLHTATWQEAQVQKLDDAKLSALFSIVKAVHKAATGQRLTIDRSFAHFKDLLLRHAVQRPPYSIGLFSVAEVKALTDWMLDSYFAHYKLYQYAFTDRVTMTVTSRHPGDIVEAPPQLPPLAEAQTEEQHQKELEAQEKQRIEDERTAAEEAARLAAEEQARQIAESYAKTMPDEIQAKVQAAMEKELERLRVTMEGQFAKQEATLRKRIAELEGQTQK